MLRARSCKKQEFIEQQLSGKPHASVSHNIPSFLDQAFAPEQQGLSHVHVHQQGKVRRQGQVHSYEQGQVNAQQIG